MGLGRFLHTHGEREDAGGTIERARAYEVMAAVWFAGRRRRVFTRLAALADARSGDTVLDVGCGTGYLTSLLAARVGPEGRATGLDPSGPMLDYARRRAPGNCSYVLGEAQDLPFGDMAFDRVVSSLAVHHIPVDARDAAMREMFRVLRPGGRLLIADFRPPTGRTGAHLTSALAGPAMARNPIGRLRGLITDAGFDVRDEGDQRPLLHYVRATRPRSSTPAPPLARDAAE